MDDATKERERCLEIVREQAFRARLYMAAMDPETNQPLYDKAMLGAVAAALDECAEQIEAGAHGKETLASLAGIVLQSPQR